jgi:hypothetical protein
LPPAVGISSAFDVAPADLPVSTTEVRLFEIPAVADRLVSRLKVRLLESSAITDLPVSTIEISLLEIPAIAVAVAVPTDADVKEGIDVCKAFHVSDESISRVESVKCRTFTGTPAVTVIPVVGDITIVELLPAASTSHAWMRAEIIQKQV